VIKKRDHELRVGALAHFEDPAFYAHTYRARVEDIAYYTQLAREFAGKRAAILEYGIGAGRVAISMAHAGATVFGVDHSRPMLDDLARKLKSEPREVRARIHARFGDMRRVRLARKFPLVVAPFNVLLHLYERADVEAFLARVREHLAPRGLFVMDLSVPMPEDLARDPLRPLRAPRFKHPSAGVVRYREFFDYDRARQILFVTMEMTPEKNPRGTFVVPLAQRQFFPREWEALLHYNGFWIEHWFGDYSRGPFDTSSEVMVIHARAR